MSDVVGAQSEADAPPARTSWLKDRVGSWPEQTRQRWLRNAVVYHMLVRYVYSRGLQHKHSTHVDPLGTLRSIHAAGS